MQKNRVLFFVIFLSVFVLTIGANSEIIFAQRNMDILSLKTGTGGTGVLPPGSFSCEASKVLSIEIDTGHMPTDFGLGKIRMTVPKRFFPKRESINPTVGGSSYASASSITEDGDNWILTLTLRSFAEVAGKITIPVQFKDHNCGVLAQGQEFIPKTELINAAGAVIETDTTMDNPILFGNTAPAIESSINGDRGNDVRVYGGAAMTVGGTNYIDPASAVPLRFDLRATIPWPKPDPTNSGKELWYDDDTDRLYKSGTYEVTLPSYPCSTGTCSAEFDAASSPGWRQVGNKLVFDYDVSGQIADSYNLVQVAEAINNAVQNKPFYLKFPNARLHGDTTDLITLNSESKNLVPVNQGAGDVLGSAADDQTFRLRSSPPSGYYAKWFNNNRIIPMDPNNMHTYSYYWALNMRNPYSYPLVLDKIVDYNLDARMIYHKIGIPEPYVAGVTAIVGVKSDGSTEAIPYSITINSHGRQEINIQPVEPETEAAIAAQVAMVEAGADPATLPTITRKYERIEITVNENGAIPPGTQNNPIEFRTKMLNPYKVEYHNYTPASSAPSLNCDKPADGGSQNLNTFCNYGRWEGHLVTPPGVPPQTISVKTNQRYELKYTPPFVTFNKVVNHSSGTLIGNNQQYEHWIRLCDFSAGFIHKNLSFTVLLPPGADFTLPSSPTTASGLYLRTDLNGAAINSIIKSRELIPNFQGTGRTAVRLVLNDFRHSDYFSPGATCPSLRGNLNFKIGQDAIPMDLEAAYMAKYAAQAGQIPSDQPNEVFSFYDWGNEVNIQPTPTADNPTGKEYGGVDGNGNFVLGYSQDVVGQDLIDANGNGSTTDFIIRASATFKASPPTEIKASKFILGSGGQPTRDDTPVAADDTYTFRLQVENKTTETESNLKIYEVLPQVGDQNYDIPGMTYPARNSEFSGKLNGPITGNEIGKYTVSYCTEPHPTWNPFDGMQDGSCSWQTAVGDYSAVTAIRIELNPGQIVDALETHYFDLPMKAPDTSNVYDSSYDFTANSFAVSFDAGQRYSVTNIVRAANNVSFPVEKIWDGGADYPAVTIDLYQSVGGGAPTLVPGKTLTLDASKADPTNPKIWRDKFTDLPAIDMQTGLLITYSVKESRPADPATDPLRYYTSTVTGSVATAGAVEGYKITNKYEPPKVEVAGTKVWVNGQAARTPVELTLYRRAEGSDTDEIVPLADLGTIQGSTCEGANPATFTPNTTVDPGNATNTVTVTWCPVQLNPSGKEYKFSVKETSPAAANWASAVDPNDPLRITNTYKVPTQSLTGKTTWINGPTAKPEAYMTLFRKVGAAGTEGAIDGELGNPVANNTETVLSAEEADPNGDMVRTMSYTWNDVPLTDEMGQPYIYNVRETDAAKAPITPDKYTKTENGLEIVNKYKVEYVEISGTKNWTGGTSLKRPAMTLGLYLHRDGKFMKPEEFAALLPTPIFGTGPDGMKTYEQAGVVNVPESAAEGIPTQTFYWYVPKTYRDGTAVVYYLDEQLGDGQAAGTPLTATDAPTDYTKAYEYTATDAQAYGAMAIRNTYKPPLVNGTGKVEGELVWIGGQKSDRQPVTLTLYRKTPSGGIETVGTQQIADGTETPTGSKHIWSDLPKTDALTGEEYKYWMDETAVTDPWTKVKSAADPTPIADNTTLTVTNKFTSPKRLVSATKIWSGGTTLPRPNVSWTLKRSVDGGAAETVPTVELFPEIGQPYAAENPFTLIAPEVTVTWRTYEKDANGKTYAFTIEEAAVADYVSTVDPAADPISVTNTYKSPLVNGNGQVTGNVVWVGGSPADRKDVELKLYRKIGPAGVPELVPNSAVTLAANAAGTHNWQHTWGDDLPERDPATGTPYIYFTDETTVPDPWTKVDNATDLNPIADNTTLTVTNYYVAPPGTINAKKVWLGGPDPKPAVTLTLYRTPAGSAAPEIVPAADLEAGAGLATENPVTLNGAPWEVSWKTASKDGNGTAYTFTVDEGAPPANYEKSVNNATFTVTNKYVSPKIEVTGRKTWIKGQVLRKAVELALFRSAGGGAAVQVPNNELRDIAGSDCAGANPVTLTPAADAGEPDNVSLTAKWCVDENDANGEAYAYEVREVSAADANWVKVENGLEVTNTFRPGLFNNDGNLVMTKRWQGGRPVAVTFKLTRETVGVAGSEEDLGTHTLTAANATGDPKVWTLTLPNMAAMDEMGRLYVYKVDETPVPDHYRKEIDNGQLTITNVYEVPQAELEVRVTWENGPEGRPATSATVTDQHGTTYVVNFPAGSVASGGTTTQTIRVPMTDADGNLLTYKVHQPMVPDTYTETIDEPAGITLTAAGPNSIGVTNKYVSPKAEVKALKVWANGETLARPEIWFKLYRKIAGGAVEEVPLAEAPLKKLENGATEAVWTNIEMNAGTGEAYEFTVKEVDSGGADYVPANYAKVENGLTVTNTYEPAKIDVTGKKVWGLGPTPRPTIWLKLYRQVSGGAAEEVPLAEAPLRELADGTTEATWPDLPGATLRGEAYVYTVKEVTAAGAAYTPAGYVKTESGLTVTNAKLSRLKVNLITTPQTSEQFGIEVGNETDVRPTHRLDYDGNDTNAPSTFTEDNLNPTLYRINIPKLDPEVWAVEGITCLMRPLDSADATQEEPLTIVPKLDLYGQLTGEFTIPEMPVEKDIDCTYRLRNKTAGRIIVKNMTYPNVAMAGIPTYNYRGEGVGYNPFVLSTTMTPNAQDVVPGTYTIGQQNVEGWVTIDMIVTSSIFGRRPAKYGGDGRINGPIYGADPAGFTATGWESIRTVEVLPKEEVTVTYVNVPPNTIMLKKETIPSGVTDKFEFAGILSGMIGDGEYLIRTNVVPDGKQHQAIEILGDGWTKHTVFCVEKGAVGQTETRPEFYTMSAYYGLDAGEVILCTFVNRKWGHDEFPDEYDEAIAAHTDQPDGMPRTGYAPGKVTALPAQSAAKLYNASELKLTVPELGVTMPIVGVPNVKGEWDVTWLNHQAGYLHGSAYPTWEGNSVITAHVWDAHNNPGPFANLKTLNYGDKIEIAAYGKTYEYEVRESKQVLESDVETVMAPKTGTWITLLTCEDYSEQTNDYRYRRVVEAVLVDVK